MNEQLKPYKTVEEIAQKHRLEVSFIQKQLDMGAPIEHEHTKNKKLATEIALQHLDEIPDYYTRLKKMESDAKKHHKKFKDVKEHCGCEDDAVEELESKLKKLNDTSYNSIDSLMRCIMKKHNMTAKQLHNAFVDRHDKTPDDWIKELKEGTLHHWFKGSKSKEGKPGWVQADGSPCANEPGETKTPKCFSSARLAALKRKGKKGESLIRSAVRRKREADKGQQQKSGAEKPKNVSTFAKDKKDPNYIKAEPGIKEAMKLNEAQKDKPGKGSGKKDACYTKVKSRYDVWPSAYASGALAKCRKVGAANWGTKSEDCWDGYKQEGMKKKGKKIVPNCVPVKEEMGMIRYCPKCGKDETRSECRYGEKYWDMFSVPSALTSNQLKYDIAQVHPANEEKQPDHEHSMARSELSTIVSAAKRLRKKLKGEGNIEAWVQSKITKAADYIDAAADYLNSGEHNVHGSMDEEISPQIPRGKSKYKFPVLPKENPDNVPITPLKRKGVELPLASKKERNLQVSNYNMKTFGEFMLEALDKSKMKCNSPKSDPVGDSLTGKSHVVKACEGGKEKIIRFGQRGVKGSPKKKGESEAYANRRKRFQTRHAKNIAKGKMSAAYWANRVKW